MKMKLNDAYADWVKVDKASAYIQGKAYDQLGRSLISFIQATIATEFSSRWEELRDAVGEVICEIIKDIGSYDPSKGSFSNWVYGITCHTCMDMRRHKISRREQVLLEDGTGSIRPKYEDRLLLKTIISTLKEEDQKLIKLKLAGFSYKDIGDGLKLSEGAVKMKWMRLEESLRTLWGGTI